MSWKQQAVAMYYNDHMKVKDIAEQLKVDKSRISRVVAGHDYELHKQERERRKQETIDRRQG